MHNLKVQSFYKEQVIVWLQEKKIISAEVYCCYLFVPHQLVLIVALKISQEKFNSSTLSQPS